MRGFMGRGSGLRLWREGGGGEGWMLGLGDGSTRGSIVWVRAWMMRLETLCVHEGDEGNELGSHGRMGLDRGDLRRTGEKGASREFKGVDIRLST